MGKAIWLVPLTSIGAGVGALLGGLAVHALVGGGGVFVGSALGGSLAAAAAEWGAARLRLISAEQVRGGASGAVLGFLVGAGIAVASLQGPFGPIIPVLSTGFTGVGALVGSYSRHRTRSEALQRQR